MNHDQARAVIEYLRPGVGGSLDGDTFTADTMGNIKWPVGRTDKPTWAEIEGAFGVAVTANARKRKIAETKAEAQKRIYALIPQWKQSNLTARAVELHHKKLNGVTLTQAELDELTAGFALWDKAKAVRVASNLIESDINASADPANFDVIGSLRWPA